MIPLVAVDLARELLCPVFDYAEVRADSVVRVFLVRVSNDGVGPTRGASDRSVGAVGHPYKMCWPDVFEGGGAFRRIERLTAKNRTLLSPRPH